MELLEPEDERKLDEIKYSSHRDVSEQCKQMFQLWLQRCPDATWDRRYYNLAIPLLDL